MNRRARDLTSASGFSLVEMLVSVCIMLAVTGGIFTVLDPTRGTFQAQLERADMQQRLRIVSDSLSKDLILAGADIHFFAPVLPMRRGPLDPDPPDIFKVDTITMLTVPVTAGQTRTSQDMAGPSSDLQVESQPGCPPTDRLCGFAAGMNGVIYDDTGAYDTFTIAAIDSATLTIARAPADLSKAYGMGARVTQVVSVTYWLNAAAGQLMRYDGMRSDAAVADNIVSLGFEYYGDAGASTTLVRLEPAMLTDGPWRPDPANPNRWDADLLRVRRIVATIRVRSALTALHLPDQEIRLDVAPRNLNLER